MQNRMGKVPHVARAIFGAHLQRVKHVNLRRRVDMIRQRRNQVGIELVFAAFSRDKGPHAAEHLHERRGIFSLFAHRPLHLFSQKAQLKLPIPNQRIKQRHEQIGLQPGSKRRRLIQIRTAENAVIQPDFLSRRQQADKRSAQRTAVSRADMAAAVPFDIVFDLFGFLQHGWKLGCFVSVKSVVTDAKHAIALFQQRNHRFKIAFPIAARAG